MRAFITTSSLAILSTFAAAPASALQSEADLAPPRCDYGAPNPEAPEQLSQFAFLIGDFTISAHAWQGEDWSPPRPGTPARWNGWYGLDGMAIVDEWYSRDPGPEPETGRGVNVRMVNPEDGHWEMMWIATGAYQVQHLRAEMIEGMLTMWQIYPENRNFRAEFEVLDEDNWQRVQYQQDEAGEWHPAFLLRATRIPCEES